MSSSNTLLPVNPHFLNREQWHFSNDLTIKEIHFYAGITLDVSFLILLAESLFGMSSLF